MFGWGLGIYFVAFRFPLPQDHWVAVAGGRCWWRQSGLYFLSFDIFDSIFDFGLYDSDSYRRV